MGVSLLSSGQAFRFNLLLRKKIAIKGFSLQSLTQTNKMTYGRFPPIVELSFPIQSFIAKKNRNKRIFVTILNANKQNNNCQKLLNLQLY